MYKKGQTPWNKGLKGYQAGEQHWSFGKKRPDRSGALNNKWKGDEAGYRAKHIWIQNQLGKPLKCEYCGLDYVPKGKKRYFDWANISGFYKREITDWIRLCKACHGTYDALRRKGEYAY